MGKKKDRRFKKGKVAVVENTVSNENKVSALGETEGETCTSGTVHELPVPVDEPKDDVRCTPEAEDVLFSLDQVVDAARECHQEIGTIENPEDDTCLVDETRELYDENTIIDFGTIANEANEETNSEAEEGPISIAPLENLKQTDNDTDDENGSQESESFKGLLQVLPLREELTDENNNDDGPAGPVAKLVSVNEIVTPEYENTSPVVHQPVTKQERDFFKEVADTDDLEYLKCLIGRNSTSQQIFGCVNDDEDEGCLTQHYVTYTSLDDGTQEIKACQVEDFQSTKVIHLPSGEIVHLDDENLLQLDENMNLIPLAAQSESQSQPEREVDKDTRSPRELLHRLEETTMPKNFACDLCPEAFEKKLQLNNHKDRRHGVKFVFTEKGKKVKLVRLPKDFEYRGGERLDPCVQMLLDAMKRGGNDNHGQGAIGVQIVEELEKPETPMHILGPDGRSNNGETDEMVTDENWESFTCGFLIDNIDTEAFEKTKMRKQTPFVAFYPHGLDSSFLLRIDSVPPEKILLVPATQHDVINAQGAILERVSYIHDARQQAGSSREVTSKCKRDFKIPIVATCHQILDEELQRYMILVNPPMKDNPVQQIDFIEVEEFRKYAQQCQGEKVRTLHEATNPMPPPKPRKPYQRRAVRSFAAASNAPQVAVADTSIHTSEPKSEVEPSTQFEQSQETPVISQDKLIRSRRCIKKEFVDPEELEDPSYEPTSVPRCKPASASSSAGRKRGRPRKVVPEGLDDCPPKSQKRATKRKDLTELMKAVETIMKKEKPSDGYEGI